LLVPSTSGGENPLEMSGLALTVEEALALFLKQNFDLFITHYGIDVAKSQQITARLFRTRP
jgi:cobalt-zinc-cadmium efflux system outer membrane protein